MVSTAGRHRASREGSIRPPPPCGPAVASVRAKHRRGAKMRAGHAKAAASFIIILLFRTLNEKKSIPFERIQEGVPKVWIKVLKKIKKKLLCLQVKPPIVATILVGLNLGIFTRDIEIAINSRY